MTYRYCDWPSLNSLRRDPWEEPYVDSLYWHRAQNLDSPVNSSMSFWSPQILQLLPKWLWCSPNLARLVLGQKAPVGHQAYTPSSSSLGETTRPDSLLAKPQKPFSVTQVGDTVEREKDVESRRSEFSSCLRCSWVTMGKSFILFHPQFPHL